MANLTQKKSYFNTVGSKDGWTPSTFVSSRNSRHKDDARTTQQRAEAYMDEEDLADAAETERIQTAQGFSGLGESTQPSVQNDGFLGIFRANGDSIGLRLMRRMGWKDGQGVGPKIRRAARLDDDIVSSRTDTAVHSFAPNDVQVVKLVKKSDRNGLGFQGENKLSSLQAANTNAAEDQQMEDDGPLSIMPKPKSKQKPKQGGIGIGILNDTGSDDEDPYEIGPKIKYNRVIGGDKKKKKSSAAVNPSLKNAPVFVPKTARSDTNFRRCHDGHLPLAGFVLAEAIDDLTSALSQFSPPSVPEGWKSSRSRASNGDAEKAGFQSTADAAKASVLNPSSRAVILGEKQLPGKSVFDFLSQTAREKMASGSGRTDLPQAKGEIPKGYEISEEERRQALWEQVPTLDRDTAIAAISRGSKGPYADNEEKRSRYKDYLDHAINSTQPLPWKLRNTTDTDYIKEMTEYFNCARIFKPMTGFMASRFTTAKASTTTLLNNDKQQEVIYKATPAVTDPAEEAAKVGMYGAMTRKVEDFYPTRLLCKRFNVRAPDHVAADNEQGTTDTGAGAAKSATEKSYSSPMPGPGPGPVPSSSTAKSDNTGMQAIAFHTFKDEPPEPAKVEIDPNRNDAVEAKTANADILHAIFGDSDDDEDV